MISQLAPMSPLVPRRRPRVGGGSSTWVNIGDVAEAAVWDVMNRAKDRQDEAIDAMRVSGGMTLDEYLESAR